MKMNKAAMLAALSGLCLCVAAPAWAHAFLKSSSPAVGAVVASAPAQISLNFTEDLVGAFSSVKISGPGGSRDFGKPRISGSTMTLPVLRPLPPGIYRVIWHATSIDTHKTQGRFSFNVQP